MGIDLGSTNSSVSVWLEKLGRTKTIRCDGSKSMRSIAWLDSKNAIIDCGKLFHDSSPAVLISGTKRLIGVRYNELPKSEHEFFPFRVTESKKVANQIVISSFDAESSDGVTPEDIATSILKELKAIAERYVEGEVNMAVLTIPAFFNEKQRACTKRAAQNAGLKVLRLVSEPMAAAMAYGLFVAGKKTITVVDMGGGTFDVSLLQIDDGKFQALALGGDNSLGGDDVDHLMMKFYASESKRSLDDLSPAELVKLKDQCEQAKISLSKSQVAWITNEFCITRENLIGIVAPLRERCRLIIRKVLNDGTVKPETIDEVVVVGLSTEMPWVRELLMEEIPCGKEICTNVKADRAVSQGAAIQAAIMTGVDRYKLSKLLMLDALPYSIGLEASDGSFSKVLDRNTTIPCSNTKTFYTHNDFQRAITVDIFEGEEIVARNNRWIDCRDFVVTGGSKLKAEDSSVDVTFNITEDGTLVVTSQSPITQNDHDDERQFYFLVAFLVFLIALFLAAKTQFPVEPIENIPAEFVY